MLTTTIKLVKYDPEIRYTREELREILRGYCDVINSVWNSPDSPTVFVVENRGFMYLKLNSGGKTIYSPVDYKFYAQ